MLINEFKIDKASFGTEYCDDARLVTSQSYC